MLAKLPTVHKGVPAPFLRRPPLDPACPPFKNFWFPSLFSIPPPFKEFKTVPPTLTHTTSLQP